MENKTKYSVTFFGTADDYDYVGNFHEGFAYVRNNYKEKKVGYIDKDGNLIIPLEYYGGFERLSGRRMDTPSFFSQGLAGLCKGDKCGFVDGTDSVVIPFEYDDVYFFSEDLAAVRKNSGWGFINKAGEIVIPLEYEWAYYFSEGLAPVKKNGKFGYIDKTGAPVIPIELEYDYAGPFCGGLAQVSAGVGEIIKSDNESIAEFQKRHSEALKNQLWGVIDKSGKLVSQLKHGTETFKEGLRVVSENGKYYYTDTAGNQPFRGGFDDAWHFNNGLAWVKINGKYGLTDKTGRLVMSAEAGYEPAGNFHGGFAAVKKDNKYGYIDLTGNIVVPTEYDLAGSVNESLAVAEKDGKWAVIKFDYDL